MTEGQRPGEAARSIGNSLTAELIEKRKTLEQLARFFSDDVVDLRRSDTGWRQEREIDLHSRSRGNRAIGFTPGRSLLDRLGIDLQTERRLRPNRGIELEPFRGADDVTVRRNLPQRLPSP